MAYSLRFDHISLQVRDLDASARFYADVLGLAEIENKTGKPMRRWFGLDGHRAIHLIGAHAPGETARPMATHFALATTRFDDALEDLTRKGIRYGDLSGANGQVAVRADGVRQVYLQDPDGHWIEINDSAGAP